MLLVPWLVFADDFVLDFHHRKIKFYLGLGGTSTEVVTHRVP